MNIKEHDDSKKVSSHKNIAITSYFIGLVIAIFALFLSDNYLTLKNVLFTISMIAVGYHVIILEGISETIEKSKNNKKFTPNAHILMGLAALGAALIGNFWEGTLLLLIFSGADLLEEYAEGRSNREIIKLIEMNPTTARLIMDNNEIKIIDVEDIKIGDTLKVLNGDQVPIDGTILSGTTSIDESAITGESMPKEKTEGDSVFASTINGTGSFIMEVKKENNDTVFSKILELVDQNQNNQTKATTMIEKFEPKYVTFVLIAVPLIILIGPYLFNWDWQESIYRGLTLLVVASPCALAASTISVTLSATSNLAKKGVLSKGSAYLSLMADINAIAFDKTGTLTRGEPNVTNYQFSGLFREQEIIDIIVALESQSNHPLAKAILEKFSFKDKLDIEVTNIIGEGIAGKYLNSYYRIGKPTSFENVILEYTNLNKEWGSEGKTVVYIAKDDEVIGILALMDIPSEHARETVNYFKENDVHTTLITGDSQITGSAVGRLLGLDEIIANVLPEDKSNIIKNQKQEYGITAMVGDGVNDAPALVMSDVGIAMGDGTDVAVEVSDLVLMQNDLSKLISLHQVSKKMQRIIWQNIIFSMVTVVFLVIASLLGLTDIAISVIVHEGSTILVILNGLRLLK